MFKLFKANVTLALSQQGLALQQAGSSPQMLSDSEFKLSELSSILAANAHLIKDKTLQVVLSNTFVRYLVLPWRDGIYRQQDWQAIAQHAFRQQYGAIADDWRIKVRLQAYGKNMLAAAIDETLCEQLDACAKQCNFNIHSITPLLFMLNEHENAWMLVAEPARLTLCQIKQGNWQQVLVDVPAHNQEYQQAEQLINRSLMHVPAAEQPNKIASYVSAGLNKNWRDDISSRQKLMQPVSKAMPHAAWLASLPVPANALNFASKAFQRPSLWAWLLLMSSLFALLMLWQQYQHIKTDVDQAKISLISQQTQPLHGIALTNHKNQQANIEQENQSLNLTLNKAQKNLNTPWLAMLAALENIKNHNPHIELTNISPNKDRAEIKLKGEAAEFSEITQLLNDLRTNPAFNDAVLLSQHVEQDAANLIYVFELNIGWR
ncbi:MAG: hypothetical protein V4545_03850 [Pseudomonadota bacterium]